MRFISGEWAEVIAQPAPDIAVYIVKTEMGSRLRQQPHSGRGAVFQIHIEVIRVRDVKRLVGSGLRNRLEFTFREEAGSLPGAVSLCFMTIDFRRPG